MNGGIRKRGSTWSYYFDLGKIGGQRKRKEKGGFKTKKAAEAALAAAINEYNNAGQVFDRERIYELVWGLDSDGNSDTIMEHIRKIRSKFAAVSTHSYIETVWGVGYKWGG